jgi:hypothetical protein
VLGVGSGGLLRPGLAARSAAAAGSREGGVGAGSDSDLPTLRGAKPLRTPYG